MSDTSQRVTALTTATSVPAPVITSGLKSIDNGYMLDGIRTIASLAYIRGALDERIRGTKQERAAFCRGAIGALSVVGIAAFADWMITRRKARSEGSSPAKEPRER